MVEALEAEETPCHTLKEYLRNPPRSIIEKTKGWMKAGDPIISATFDVATGRRMVELYEKNLAIKFLGQKGALREVERSAKSGFLTEIEARRLKKKLRKLTRILENGPSNPQQVDLIFSDLRNIQIFLDKRHYVSFIKWLIKRG